MKKRYLVSMRAIILIGLYIRAKLTYGSIQSALLLLVIWIKAHQASVLIYSSLYLIRPFILLPVGRLSVIAGVFRGWRPGVLIALGGEFLSACIAFNNGKHLSREALDSQKEASFGKFSFVLLRYPLLAVFLSRMSPLPDDVVNYGWGILRISRTTYIRGTILGNAPFSLLNVAMGIQIDPAVLLSQGISSGITWSSLLVLLAIYGGLLIGSGLIYKRIVNKEH